MKLLEKEWYIQAPWGRICVVAWGNCLDPPVLLCHGNIDSAASLRPLVSLLPKNFYYVCLELPGNGKSDHFPPGMPINSYDMMYSLVVAVRHFRWKQFVYIGHSFGACIGKMYAIVYPGKMSKLVELDPITYEIVLKPQLFSEWYRAKYYEYVKHNEKFNKSTEHSPKYKKEEAVAKLVKNRKLTAETAEATLERWSEPAGDGYIRFTFDQRLKLLAHYPLPGDVIKELYTRVEVPTLAIATDQSISRGYYNKTKFSLDEKCYPHGNYRVRVVSGCHDVHFVNPAAVAPYVANFLLYGLSGLGSVAKL